MNGNLHLKYFETLLYVTFALASVTIVLGGNCPNTHWHWAEVYQICSTITKSVRRFNLNLRTLFADILDHEDKHYGHYTSTPRKQRLSAKIQHYRQFTPLRSRNIFTPPQCLSVVPSWKPLTVAAAFQLCAGGVCSCLSYLWTCKHHNRPVHSVILLRFHVVKSIHYPDKKRTWE